MALHKITVLGDTAVGKTALIIQLISDCFIESYDPTIEDLYQRRILIGHEDYTLEILDTAGADTQFYQDLHQKWISHGEGFILVYSVTSRSSFLRPLGLGDRNISSMKAPHIPIILIGNQCDSLERAVSIQEGDALAQEIGCHFVESTAKSCDSAHEIFSHMVRQLRRQSVMLRGQNIDIQRLGGFKGL
ncbi:small GTPase superfamily [Bisporella sp. PMI_857]|nr:small GTPase superfamily [Bisporella sp. PMI_857]